ncbi:MAG: hypothetical protein PF436_02655 [Prolixibacteraceae bacterium]|jgi:hypothetical protein|nr:hypothetical protein [Prolixibacteraceae bacterium]
MLNILEIVKHRLKTLAQLNLFSLILFRFFYPYINNNGQVLIGENTNTGERRFINLPLFCTFNPVTDDMVKHANMLLE